MKLITTNAWALSAALILTSCSTSGDTGGPEPGNATSATVQPEQVNDFAASGGDTDSEVDEPEQPPAAETDTAEDSAEEPEAVSSGEALGTVRINDSITYTITQLRKCDPYDDEFIERELELQGFGEHDGERVQVDVYIETIAGAPFHDVSWAGPEGAFGSDGEANITWGADESNVLGSATLVDAWTQEEQLQLDFDLGVPAETATCR